MKLALTKLELHDQLSAAVVARGGEFIRLGGDCYVARVESEVRLAIALKESDKSKRMWVGAPEPMKRLMMGVYQLTSTGEQLTTHVNRVLIALIHKPTRTVLLIPLHDVWKAIIEKSLANRSDIEWSFDLEMTGYHRYVVKQGPDRADIPITFVSWQDAVAGSIDLPLSAKT